MPQTITPSIAAITPSDESGLDIRLHQFLQGLIVQGWKVHGLIQDNQGTDLSCDIILSSLTNGGRYTITQDLGACSSACRLDPAALAEAGQVYRLDDVVKADLVVFNRFGKLEIEGQGFSAEMLALMSQEIPVLVIVHAKYLTAWRHFTGGLSAELSADPEQWMAWCSDVRQARQAQYGSP